MRFLTTTDWTIKRGLLLAGVVVAVCGVLSIILPWWVTELLATALPITCLIPPLRHPIWVYIVVWASAFLCVFGWFQLSSVDSKTSLAGHEDTITAQVVDLPASGHMVTVEILDADRLPRGERVLLYCNEQVMPKLHQTVCSDVEYRALYTTQQGYRADGAFLQAYPTNYDENAMTVTDSPRFWRTALDPLRERLLDNIRTRLNTEEGAVLAGICLGEKSGISEQTMTLFRRAGLPHVLVVSGLHLSVISTGAYMLLRWLIRRRRIASGLTMILVLFFMAIVGFTPSVVRAGVMCLVMLSGQLFTRRADGLNSMGLALIILLATNPYGLLDVGLQLSFAAAGGVLCLARPLEERLCSHRVVKLFASGLAVTLAASLPTLPLLGYYFGEVSVVSPLANLLAVAVAGVALTFGWIGTLLATIPVLSFAANGVLYLAGWLIRWLLTVAYAIGGLPFATAPTDRAWAILYLTGGCLLGILCIYKANRELVRRTVIFLSATLVLACGADRLLHRDTTVITVSSQADGAVLLLEQNGRHGLIAQNVAGIYVNDTLIRACDGELDFVIVGDGETPDAAYLTDLLRQVTVAHLYIAEGAPFTNGLTLTASPIANGSTIPLWADTSLAVDDGGCWRLSCHGTTLAISPDEPCAADGAIFVGEPPTEAENMTVGQGILLADKNDPATFAAVETLPYPMATVTDETIYLTTRDGGEWSVNRWR